MTLSPTFRRAALRLACALSVVALAGAGSCSSNPTAPPRKSHYTVDVRFYGTPMTEAQKALFTAAAARIVTIIADTVPDVATGSLNLATYCAEENGPPRAGLPTINETIPGIVIYAAIQPIDGAGKILAQSGPCAIRDTLQHNLPAVGVMEFDSADFNSLASGGSLQSVILHEMMHVIGFGTLWTDPKRPSHDLVVGALTPQSRYIGAGGIQGCREVGGAAVCANGVPLETGGDDGTRDAHWSESIFRSELMTGYAERSGPMPLSVMTIRSLTDLGYAVNLGAADPYTVPNPTPVALRSLRAAGDGPWERQLAVRGVTLGAHGVIQSSAPALRVRRSMR